MYYNIIFLTHPRFSFDSATIYTQVKCMVGSIYVVDEIIAKKNVCVFNFVIV